MTFSDVCGWTVGPGGGSGVGLAPGCGVADASGVGVGVAATTRTVPRIVAYGGVSWIGQMNAYSPAVRERALAGPGPGLVGHRALRACTLGAGPLVNST